MSVGAEIGVDCVREIYAWLDEIPLSRPKRNVARDFSDGVLMAELLKRYYPRYVDVQNYVPGCSIAKKVDNWCTLNRKVFPKLNLKLSKETMNKVAQCEPGAIERVLSQVRCKIIKDCNADRNSMLKGCNDIGDGHELMKNATNPEDSLNKTVPQKLFLKLKKELEEKTQAINILLKKVEHLESMLRFKEQRINALTSQIQSYTQKT